LEALYTFSPLTSHLTFTVYTHPKYGFLKSTMHTDDICYYILAITMKESRTLVSNGLTSMMVHRFLT